MNKLLDIEIAYAMPDRQCVLKIKMPLESTIEAAIRFSGLLNEFPEIDLAVQVVGIFGKRRELTDIVQVGDRIEIYRPLLIDPKVARRAKAKKKAGTRTNP